MRTAFADTLVDMAAANERLVLLTAALDAQEFNVFRERFGDRYRHFGTAEAQMVCTAADMAREGWRPICYSHAASLTARAFDEIRAGICCPQLPVLIAGDASADAASAAPRHAADDLALMAALPAMTVIVPGDPGDVRALLPQVCPLDGPAYLRIGRSCDEAYQTHEASVLGRARLLHDGERIGIVCAGDVTPGVLAAVERLHANGIRPLTYQMHTLKPLDAEALARMAAQVGTLFIVEDALQHGSLYSAVCRWKAESDAPVRVRRPETPDAVAPEILGQDMRRPLPGCDADAVFMAVLTAWRVSMRAHWRAAMRAACQAA